jgi:hypothetical protein
LCINSLPALVHCFSAAAAAAAICLLVASTSRRSLPCRPRVGEAAGVGQVMASNPQPMARMRPSHRTASHTDTPWGLARLLVGVRASG